MRTPDSHVQTIASVARSIDSRWSIFNPIWSGGSCSTSSPTGLGQGNGRLV